MARPRHHRGAALPRRGGAEAAPGAKRAKHKLAHTDSRAPAHQLLVFRQGRAAKAARYEVEERPHRPCSRAVAAPPGGLATLVPLGAGDLIVTCLFFFTSSCNLLFVGLRIGLQRSCSGPRMFADLRQYAGLRQHA